MAVSQTLSCRNCWLQLARRTKLHQRLPLCTWGGAFFLLSGDHKGIEKPNFCVCSITLLYPAVLLCLNKCFLSLLRLTCKPALSNVAAPSAHEQKWRIFWIVAVWRDFCLVLSQNWNLLWKTSIWYHEGINFYIFMHCALRTTASELMYLLSKLGYVSTTAVQESTLKTQLGLTRQYWISSEPESGPTMANKKAMLLVFSMYFRVRTSWRLTVLTHLALGGLSNKYILYFVTLL